MVPLTGKGTRGSATSAAWGEVRPAHGGVLFLDEVSELSRATLDTMREPLEEGSITISRAGWAATYPARFTLVAASNPCPCGHHGDPETACTCLPDQVARYRSRLSGPLLDRIDLRVAVPRVPCERLRDDEAREPSAAVRARVIAARERMRRRGRGTNAELTVAEVRRHCALEADAERLVGDAMRQRRLSARAYHRVLRVSRTLADLAQRDRVAAEDVALALLLRAP